MSPLTQTSNPTVDSGELGDRDLTGRIEEP